MGTYAYAEQAEILLLAYAIGDQGIQCWDRTQDERIPDDLREAFDDPAVCCIAHNSSFERVLLKHCLGFNIPAYRWRCTMVASRMAGLPASLEAVCQTLKLPEDLSKMAIEGKKLIRRYCYGGLEFSPKRDPYWELFKEYCRKDVEACREIYRRLPSVPASEGALWVLDQEINDRGYQIDLELASKADTYVLQAMRQLDQEVRDLTAGKLYSARCVSALLEWLKVFENIALSDLQESTLSSVLQRHDLSDRAHPLLKNRLEASRSAPRKLQTLIDAVSSDGRLRGTLQFFGASRTGRWAGRVFQPQNIPRPNSSTEEIEKAIQGFSQGSTVLEPIRLAVLDRLL